MSATDNQLIAIKTPIGKSLSKLQKQFNTYSQKVENLKKELHVTQDIIAQAEQKVRQVLVPLEVRKLTLKAEVLWVLDRQYDSGGLKKRDREQLAEFIVTQAHPLIEKFGKEELKPLIEKYENKTFEEYTEDLYREKTDHLKELFEKFGIEADDEYRNNDAQNPFQQSAGGNTESEPRPKTAKQLAKEEKRRQEAQNISKTVQNVYRQLVKLFHPDREPDVTEKERKTRIMQLITEAYEKDDLFELLRLQLEYNQKDSGDFAILPDEQLKYYNQLLKEQIAELESELEALKFGSNPYQASFYQQFCHPPERLDSTIKREASHLKKQLKAIEEEKKAFTSPENVKYFLEQYRQMQRQSYNPFDELF